MNARAGSGNPVCPSFLQKRHHVFSVHLLQTLNMHVEFQHIIVFVPFAPVATEANVFFCISNFLSAATTFCSWAACLNALLTLETQETFCQLFCTNSLDTCPQIFHQLVDIPA